MELSREELIPRRFGSYWLTYFSKHSALLCHLPHSPSLALCQVYLDAESLLLNVNDRGAELDLHSRKKTNELISALQAELAIPAEPTAPTGAPAAEPETATATAPAS
eukprot:6201547-Pleurochrysis_carterae.AAC.1